jgi:hypothetical protein
MLGGDVERSGTRSLGAAQAEAWGLLSRFGLFASPTRQIIEESGEDSCPLRDSLAACLEPVRLPDLYPWRRRLWHRVKHRLGSRRVWRRGRLVRWDR